MGGPITPDKLRGEHADAGWIGVGSGRGSVSACRSSPLDSDLMTTSVPSGCSSSPLVRVLLLAIGAASALALTACSSAPRPELSLAGAQVVSTSDAGSVVNFTIDAKNLGPEPVTLYDVDYTLQLDGREVFRGVRAGESVLGRYATRQVVLPASIPASELTGTGERRATLNATFRYVPPTAFREVLFDAGVWQPTTTANGDVTLAMP